MKHHEHEYIMDDFSCLANLYIHMAMCSKIPFTCSQHNLCDKSRFWSC